VIFINMVVRIEIARQHLMQSRTYLSEGRQ